MFFEFLKGIYNGFGRFLGWVFKYLVPEDVKQKFAGLITTSSLKERIFFVLQIFTSWYFFMTIAAIIVVYNLFRALKSTGILDKFQSIVEKVVYSVISISSNCFPDILDLKKFFECVNIA